MTTKHIKIYLCLILSCCALIFFLIACDEEEQPNQTITSDLVATQSETPISETSVLISIEPEQLIAQPRETVQFTINVKSGERILTGGEINLSFDPQSISIVELESGDLFGSNPLVGTREIDNQAGTIRYALARVGSSETSIAEATLASLTVQILDSADSGTYTLSLSDVGLADHMFTGIEGILTKNATIEIQ